MGRILTVITGCTFSIAATPNRVETTAIDFERYILHHCCISTAKDTAHRVVTTMDISSNSMIRLRDISLVTTAEDLIDSIFRCRQ